MSLSRLHAYYMMRTQCHWPLLRLSLVHLIGICSANECSANETKSIIIMIKLTKLSKQYHSGPSAVIALDEVDLAINQGEFIAIMGPSGSGKSSLMNILGCLDKATSGQFELAGTEIIKLDDDALSELRNQQIGFVFQTFHLQPRLTAIENVMLPQKIAGVDKQQARQNAVSMLQQVGLAERLAHKPFEMSGGQRQRVAIARALINQPSIILADEPTGNLDSKTSVEVMELFSQLHQSGQTIILVTHEPEIAAYAQRVVYMRDGKVEKIETH